MDTIDVLLVDDHAVVRSGVRGLLEKDPTIRVVGEAGSLSEAFETLSHVRPRVIVLDMQLGSESGLDLIPLAHDIVPDVAFIVLSAFLNPTLLQRCMDEHVSGYLIKDTQKLDLVSAVKVVAAGGTVFDPRFNTLQHRMADGGPYGLTPRETQVLGLVCKGLSNKEISEELGVTEGAVKGYVSTIMHRFGCKNRVQVVLEATKLNYQ